MISTTDGGTRRYLVYWKGKPESDDSWLDRKDMQHLDPDALEQYESSREIHSTTSTFPTLGELMRTSEHGTIWTCLSAQDGSPTC